MSYNNYQASVLEVAKELAVFERSAPPTMRGGVQKLNEALTTYRDAGTFWQKSIEFYASQGNGLAYHGGLPMDMVGLGWMVDKYKLPTRNADVLGLNVGVPTDGGRQRMWLTAAQQVEIGLALLRDPDAVPQAPPVLAMATISGPWGLTVSELTAEDRLQLSIQGGVAVKAVTGIAERAGIKEGDVIMAIGNETIGSLQDFQSRASAAVTGRPIPVLLRRGRLATYLLIRQ